MNAVPTVDEVIQQLAAVGLEPSPASDPDLALSAAITTAERSTGLFYRPVTEQRAFSGSCPAWTAECLWPLPLSNGGVRNLLPIDTAQDITDVSTTTGGCWWGGGPPYPLTPLDPSAYSAYPASDPYKTGLIYVDGTWPPGVGNIWVTATFGSPMDPAVYEATILYACRDLYPGCTRTAAGQGMVGASGPVSEYREGEVSVKYAIAPATLAASSLMGVWDDKIKNAFQTRDWNV